MIEVKLTECNGMYALESGNSAIEILGILNIFQSLTMDSIKKNHVFGTEKDFMEAMEKMAKEEKEENEHA